LIAKPYDYEKDVPRDIRDKAGYVTETVDDDKARV
jgi:hypothetical protein